ncbi:cytochrome c-type biogenesis protein [Budvicia aquatica]|uniref:cytochrome c-type biogenesis protein n=1 Tax=Budvicia aquatica TaxID=82979 RepID=UPI002085A86D|nr:cytochrome c-type biogenesis protein [Budvicia aquatica]GKX51689.1 cytochrome c-type biogenesis protein CcmH [Budvicia aquatica]
MLKQLSFMLFGVMMAFGAHAAIDTYDFKSVDEEQQFRELTNQLRCPKCQNNSIADSNAPIATDMRAKVYELMEQGKSRQDIVNYMVDRYGNFVTYEPPVTPATIILWVIPALCVVIGGGAVIMLARRRKGAASGGEPEVLSSDEKKRLQQLLSDENNAKGRKS